MDGAAPAGAYNTVTTEELLLPGVQVYCGQGPGTRLHVLADVTVDESFMEENGLRWRDQVRRMVQNLNQILAPVRVEIDVASLQTWDSDCSVNHFSQRLAAAKEQTGRGDGNLLIALTAGASSRFDGLARRADGAVIVRHYPKHPERGPMLMAHEIGHLLGANHHGDDDGWGDEECIMASRVYIETKE